MTYATASRFNRSNDYGYSRPAAPRTFTPSTTAPASERAMGFLDTLTAERDWNTLPAPLVSVLTERRATPATFTAAKCSWAIDQLKALPRPQAPAAEPVSEGFYLLGSEVYKVQASRESGRIYAKVLVLGQNGEKGRFEFKAGAMRLLRPEHRMTLAEAAALGHATGCCVICGATLTDPASVQRGIGPICASRL